MAASGSQDVFQLIQTRVKVNGNEINFSNLIINEALADVNNFSFIWRQEEGTPSLQSHISFYRSNLGKQVDITIGQDYSFKGLVDGINCVRQDELGVEYEIVGTGMLGRLNEVPECKSYYKKKLTDIFNDRNSSGASLKLNPKNNDVLFYTVQYNQTTFEFYKLLAARYGEWLYYNGNDLVLGDLGTTQDLRIDVDVHDIFINATIKKAGKKITGFDRYTGKQITSEMNSSAPGSGLVNVAIKEGDHTFGSGNSPAHFPHAATNNILTNMNTLRQKAAAASSVFVSGTSHNSGVKIGCKIKFTGATGSGNDGEYIVTQVHHTCLSDSSYQNQFMAIPADAEVPPYTNPFLITEAKAQPALVTKNEDKDGQDRIQVQFPWQGEAEYTPWINVVTPHAGKDKGIRFLPEIGEEVLVDFVNHNAEHPFVLGAIHTEQNKSGDVEKANNQKVIGTKSGRRLEIDEENGTTQLVDNFKGKTPKNVLNFKRKDSEVQISMISMKGDNDVSIIQMNKDESLKIGLQNGGNIVHEILLEKGGKKLTIHSTGTIDIKADQDINISGANININASQALKMEGKGSGAELKGLKVGVEASTGLDVKGLNVKVEGTAKLELSSAALASMAAALVKIN